MQRERMELLHIPKQRGAAYTRAPVQTGGRSRCPKAVFCWLINHIHNCREIYLGWEEDFLLQQGMLRPGCYRGFEPSDTFIVSFTASNPPQVFNPASHCFSSISLSKMALPADVDFCILSSSVFKHKQGSWNKISII